MKDPYADPHYGFVIMCLFIPCVLAGAWIAEQWDSWWGVFLILLGAALWVIGLIVWMLEGGGGKMMRKVLAVVAGLVLMVGPGCGVIYTGLQTARGALHLSTASQVVYYFVSAALVMGGWALFDWATHMSRLWKKEDRL